MLKNRQAKQTKPRMLKVSDTRTETWKGVAEGKTLRYTNLLHFSQPSMAMIKRMIATYNQMSQASSRSKKNWQTKLARRERNAKARRQLVGQKTQQH